MRGLFADAAISAAFVPVFTELLEKGKRREAFQLASTLLLVILGALGALTLFFILAAGVVMPLFTGDKFTTELDAPDVGLSQVLFPIVVLLGVNGLVVGILNAYEHFTIPAIAPLVWNVVIIALAGRAAAALRAATTRSTPTRSACWLGTIVQLGDVAAGAAPRSTSGSSSAFDWRDPRIKQVFVLMLPVTIGLGRHQLRPRHQLDARLAGLRAGAARDRRRVPDLHAARRACSASRWRPCCSRR